MGIFDNIGGALSNMMGSYNKTDPDSSSGVEGFIGKFMNNLSGGQDDDEKKKGTDWGAMGDAIMQMGQSGNSAPAPAPQVQVKQVPANAFDRYKNAATNQPSVLGSKKF